jgi:hypothetical protein
LFGGTVLLITLIKYAQKDAEPQNKKIRKPLMVDLHLEESCWWGYNLKLKYVLWNTVVNTEVKQFEKNKY